MLITFGLDTDQDDVDPHLAAFSLAHLLNPTHLNVVWEMHQSRIADP